MSDVTTNVPHEGLPALIARAAASLAQATTAAEILDATNEAKAVYEVAKTLARLSRIKEAHDEIVAACRQAMADALVIEVQAQIRLADEYDRAQERGEVVGPEGGNPNLVNRSTAERLASVADIGLTRKQIHEARNVRNAEKKKPGIVQRTLEAKLKAGSEPLRADVKRAVQEAIAPPLPPRPASPPPPRPEAPVTPAPKPHDEDETARRKQKDVERQQAWRALTPEQLVARIEFYRALTLFHFMQGARFKGAIEGLFERSGLDGREYVSRLDVPKGPSARYADDVDAAYDEVEWQDDEIVDLEWIMWDRGEDEDDGSE
jgi:hypothetical protein